MYRLWAAIASTVVLLALPGCRGRETGTQQTPLGCIPKNVKSLTASPDGTHYAYVLGRGDKSVVVVDGAEGQAYDEVGEGHPLISPDGSRVAYAARQKGGWTMVEDGSAGSVFDGLWAESLVFATDGKRSAYAAFRGDSSRPQWARTYQDRLRWVVVDGNQESAVFDDVGMPVLSADGLRLAFAAGTYQPNMAFGGPFATVNRIEKTWAVVVDGRPGHSYGSVGRPVFSTDGKRVAYAARRGSKWLMVVDGKEQGDLYDAVGVAVLNAIGECRPVFSPDSRRLAYQARRGDQWYLVADGKPEAIDGPPIHVVLDQTGQATVTLPPLVFSPDGKLLAHVAAANGAAWVVVNGTAGPHYAEVAGGGPVFSPDGQHIAYAAKKGETWCIMLDGSEQQTHYSSLSSVLFSPDGNHLAYIAGQGERSVVVANGIRGPECDRIVSGLRFQDDNAVEYVALRDNRLYHIQHLPPQARAR